MVTPVGSADVLQALQSNLTGSNAWSSVPQANGLMLINAGDSLDDILQKAYGVSGPNLRGQLLKYNGHIPATAVDNNGRFAPAAGGAGQMLYLPTLDALSRAPQNGTAGLEAMLNRAGMDPTIASRYMSALQSPNGFTTDPVLGDVVSQTRNQANLSTRGPVPGITSEMPGMPRDFVSNYIKDLRSADPTVRGAAASQLSQVLEQMWWNNDPRLAPVMQQLLAGLSPEEISELLKLSGDKSGNALRQARPDGSGIGRAGKRGNYYNGGREKGSSGVNRSDKTTKDAGLSPEKVYPPGSEKAKQLFREAAKLAGVPESWADSSALHNILAKESAGKVGRPNYTYGDRAKDPASWGAVHEELKRGVKSTRSSATGLGQLLLDNVDRYYPAGRKGIGDPLQEAAGMLGYIKDRYGSPENAWARYGKAHEGY